MKTWVVWIAFIAGLIILIGLTLSSLAINNLVFPSDLSFFSWLNSLLPDQGITKNFWRITLAYGIVSFLLGIFLFYIAISPFKKIEKWSWHAIFISVMMWFTIGATISIMYLIYIDMIIYSSVLIFTLLPLLFTQKAFIIRRDLI